MKRHEHGGIEPAGDGCAVVKRKIVIVVAGQSDADPAPLDQLVAKLAREGERQVFFGDLARRHCSRPGRGRHGRRRSPRSAGLRRWVGAVNAVVDGGREVDCQAGLAPGPSADAAPPRLEASTCAAPRRGNAAPRLQGRPALVQPICSSAPAKPLSQQPTYQLIWLMRNCTRANRRMSAVRAHTVAARDARDANPNSISGFAGEIRRGQCKGPRLHEVDARMMPQNALQPLFE